MSHLNTDHNSHSNLPPDILELSDFYLISYLSCLGFKYQTRTETTASGQRRVVFLFKEKIREVRKAVKNYYSRQNDQVSASSYSRILKDLKAMVFNL